MGAGLNNVITYTLVVTGCTLAFAGAAWAIERTARKLHSEPVRYNITEEDLMNPHWSNRVEPGALQPGALFMETNTGKQFKVVERLEQVNTDVSSPSVSSGWLIELVDTKKRQFLADATFVAMSTANVVTAL